MWAFEELDREQEVLVIVNRDPTFESVAYQPVKAGCAVAVAVLDLQCSNPG